MRELLEEYVPQVYRFALRLTNDVHAAEDLTQETFLRAWRRRRSLRDPRTARVWLFRITANLWRDQLRRNQLLVARAGPLPYDEPGHEPAPDEQVAGLEEVRRVLKAVQALPDRQRNVLCLTACEELSAADIALVLGTTADAVKASLCVARKKLREQFRDLFANLFLAL